MNEGELEIDFAVTNPLESRYEELVKRHKQESKRLIAVTTKWRKQANKPDKKAVNKTINDVQVKLSTKHKQELELFKSSPLSNVLEQQEQNQLGSEDPDELTPEQLMNLTLGDKPDLASKKISPDMQPEVEPQGESTNGSTTNGGKKRNRQKERLAKRAAQINQMKLDAQEEAKDLVDYRTLEINKINDLVESKNLTVKDILPDGNCLFNSVKDQLLIRHNKLIEVSELRAMAGEYIQQNADDFTPFLIEKDELDLSAYCDKLVNTTLWGSDLEVMAFLKIFDCPIEVVLTDANKLVFNESAQDAKLFLAYYKHSYGLGEHYNSLRDQ